MDDAGQLPTKNQASAQDDTFTGSKYQALYEHSSAAIVVISPDWKLIDFNQAWSDLLGYERSELLGVSPQELTHPDDEQHSQELINDLASGKTEKYRMEKRYIRKDGTVIWGDLSAKALRTSSGAIDTIVATIIDISEFKEQEKELKASEARFHDFAKAASDYFWEMDEDLVYTYLGERFAVLTGQETSTMIGKSRHETRPIISDEAWEKHLDDVTNHRPFQGFLHKRLHDDGSEVWLEGSGTPFHDNDGQFKGYRGTARNVTTEIESQQAARLAQEQLREAIESIPEGFVVYDKDDRLVLSNKKYVELFDLGDGVIVPGATFEEILRAGVEQGKYLEANEDPETFIKERMRTHQRTGEAVEHQIADGRWLHIDEGRTHDGGIVGIRTDVTELKRAELKLRESEERFREFAESASDWLWEIDSEGRFSWQSNSGNLTDGLTLEVLLGMTRQEISGDLMQPSAWLSYENALKNHTGIRNFELCYAGLDGETHYALINGKPMFDGSGSYMGHRGTASNVTERKDAEAARLLSEMRFESVVRYQPSSLLLKSTDGKFQVVNKAFEDWYGLAQEDVIGKTSEELFPQQYAEGFVNQDKEVLETGQVVERETLVVFADGKAHPIYNIKFPVFDDDGTINGIGTIATDLTQFNILEDKLRRAQKMEAVGQLTGGVAHDFNNLLTAIIGNAELLENKIADDKNADDKNARRNIAAIIKAVNRGSSLTSRLLAFSRKQVLLPQSVTVDVLVLGLEEMLQRTLGATVELKFHLDSGVSEVFIDPHQFEDALVNLSINARDAMPGGGVLTVRTSAVTLEQTSAEKYEEVTAGDYTKVEVSDTGGGILPDVLEKVFEPFFTTKEVGEGSGLGLSMVYGFTKQSKGHITIDSKIGNGTTVNLFLPRSSKSEVLEKSENGTSFIAQGSERILVVEDDEDILEISATTLKKEGYQIIAAKNGKDAVKLLKDGPPTDLLFTDIVLPGGMSGIEFAEQAKQIQPGIKVLYTSGYRGSFATLETEFDKDMVILSKPYRRAELLEKVRAALDGTDV